MCYCCIALVNFFSTSNHINLSAFQALIVTLPCVEFALCELDVQTGCCKHLCHAYKVGLVSYFGFTVDTVQSFPRVLPWNDPKLWKLFVIFAGLSILFYLAILALFLHFAICTITINPASTVLCVSNNNSCSYMDETKLRCKEFALMILCNRLTWGNYFHYTKGKYI